MNTFKLVNNDKSKCSGCGLCSTRCPKNAIKMQEDEYGFLYAFIDEKKCINCGICKKICPYNKINANTFKKKVFVSNSNNEQVLNTTASGGVFTSIATSFIKNDGVVFGSTLQNENNSFVVKHVKITSIDELEKLKGSKYVQSDISNIYPELKEELDKNKKVLFSGTPCQIAAVKKFCNDSNNLYTIDIICHGVPSNKLFNDYINYVNKKENIEIKNYKFRVKDKGWGLYYFYCDFFDVKTKNKKVKVRPAIDSSYYQLFLDSYTYRKNCYSCPFANDNRISDVTIGDFWGIEKEHKELIKNKKINIKKGVSCIIVNTEKGMNLLENNKDNIILFESNFQKVRKYNHQLDHPCKMPNDRELILKKYEEKGYKEVDKYYKNKYKLKRIAKRIWYKIPYTIRKIIKK